MALTEADRVTLTKMDSLDISLPSEEEKHGSYHGLSTCSRLIGCVSSAAYRRASYQDQLVTYLASPSPRHRGHFMPRRTQLLRRPRQNASGYRSLRS